MMFGLKIMVERTDEGFARITSIGPDGEPMGEHIEDDLAKATAMLDALENAEGGSKLGVPIGPGSQ